MAGHDAAGYFRRRYMDNRLPGYVRRFERCCSMAVRHLLDDTEQLYPSIIKGYRQILTVCSICSTFLYLTGHTELFFSGIRDKNRFFSYGRWGAKVSNKSNRIENIISIPYIYWLCAVRHSRTSVEHLSNTVRRSVEQRNEHHNFFQPRFPRLFDGSSGQVRSCSTNHRTTRSPGQQTIKPFLWIGSIRSTVFYPTGHIKR